jgi:hypothetical protein
MKSTAFFLLVACVFLGGDAATQEPSRGPDAGIGHGHIPGVDVLPIPNSQFSAKTTTEWVRTLEDGSTVNLHLDAFLARDSHGRVYRENHHFVPANTKAEAPLYEIHLLDPVTRTQLHCLGKTYECVLSKHKPTTYFETTPEGSYDQGTRTLTRERLGTDTIEGLPVIGTRETWTVRPGADGNEQPLVSTREFWYSEELQTNLAVTRIDPRVGKQIIHLSHISRAEPDPHLWEVPIGFRVRDLRSSVQRGR